MSSAPRPRGRRPGESGARLRANLVASQIIGLAAARYVAQVEPLASLGAEEIVPLVGPTLQRYVDGPL